MSKRIITVDPNLLKSSSSNPSRKSKKKFDKTKKADKAHNVNYEKLLGKIKEMKKNKLQQTKKKKRVQVQPTDLEPKTCDVDIKETAISIQPIPHIPITQPTIDKSTTNESTTNEPIEITPETTFSKNTDPNSIIETPIIVETPQIPTTQTIAPPPVAPPTLPIIIHPEPQYGILKNGKKPTRKNHTNSISKAKTRFEKLRTIKRKYKLGKDGKKISVLLKDNKTRKKIKSEIQDLKQKSIKEVRTFLQEKNMIKAGSIAPNNVLRKMYEDMYLTGNIENKNSENLIHNYVNNEEIIN